MPIKDPVKRRENHRRYMREVWYPKHRETEEVRARLIVRNEVKFGRLDPVSEVPCKNCGSRDLVQRHHPDHSQPLVFVELCIDCHREADTNGVGA